MYPVTELSALEHEFTDIDSLPDLVKNVVLPSVLDAPAKMVRSGLCVIVRHVIKVAHAVVPDDSLTDLLVRIKCFYFLFLLFLFILFGFGNEHSMIILCVCVCAYFFFIAIPHWWYIFMQDNLFLFFFNYICIVCNVVLSLLFCRVFGKAVYECVQR